VQIVFDVPKSLLPFIEFNDGCVNDSKTEWSSVRQALFDDHPYPVKIKSSRNQLNIKDNSFSIWCQHGCGKIPAFKVTLSWQPDSDNVECVTTIDMTKCECSIDSMEQFYKRSSCQRLRLYSADPPLGEIFNGSLAPSVGRAILVGVSDNVGVLVPVQIATSDSVEGKATINMKSPTIR